MVLPQAGNLVELLTNFFGDEIDGNMVRAAGLLPSDQALTLAQLIEDLAVALSTSARQGTYTNAILNESLLFADPAGDPAKRLATTKLISLYADEALVTSEIFEWADGVVRRGLGSDRSALTSSLRVIRQLLPLHRSKAIHFVPTESTFDVLLDQDRPGAYPVSIIDIESDWIWFDPVVASRLIERNIDPRVRDLQDFDLGDPGIRAIEAGRLASRLEMEGKNVAKAIEQGYEVDGRRLDYPAIRRSAQLYALQYSLDGLALPSDYDIYRHLHDAGQIVSQAASTATGSSLTSWSLPGTSDLTVEEVAMLREGSDELADFRAALRELADLATHFRADTFIHFEDAVHEAAADVLQPIHDRIIRELRQSRAKSLIAEWGAKMATRLVLSGGAYVAPSIAPFAGPTSSLAGRLARRMTGRKQQPMRVALKLIGQLTDQG